MNILAISDLHFTDKTKDVHRYEVFPQTEAHIKANPVDYLVIAGDLTHEIDHHSAITVNKIATGIKRLSDLCPIVILLGNHDLKDTALPYFNFLNNIPRVEYIKVPTTMLMGQNTTFLPHTRDPLTDWASIMEHIEHPDAIVFAHVCVNDVIAETGQKLKSSVDASIFDKAKMAFSGDIHKQQKIRNLEYIGSPYPTSFSDNEFQGRGVLIDTFAKTVKDLAYKFPRRLTFEIQTVQDFKKLADKYKIDGDQVKVKMILNKDNMGTERVVLEQLKQEFEQRNSEWLGFVPLPSEELTPQKTDKSESANATFSDFESYCQKEGVSGALRAAMDQAMVEVKNASK